MDECDLRTPTKQYLMRGAVTGIPLVILYLLWLGSRWTTAHESYAGLDQ
jgi:hypothetical protein